MSSNDNEEKTKYKLLKVWESDGIREPGISRKERQDRIDEMSELRSTPFPPGVARELCEMPFHEEAIVVVFWFLVFSLLLYGPIVSGLLLYYRPKIGVILLAFVFGLSAIMPSAFSRDICNNYLSTLILKYFSYRSIWKEYPDYTKPFICVCPPHGLFPFGGVAGAIAIPRFGGYHVRGIAANAILFVPIIGNFLSMLGVISASRENCKRHLRNDSIIGISSGGIAEIFETNSSPGSETECIILKSRGGICKLALQTGSNLLPSYLYGNSKALNVWHDSFGIMRGLSRLLRVSLVFFTGRWGLPIPYRTPMLGVAGKMIEVPKIDNPTEEDVEKLLKVLEDRIKDTFDTHKAAYGWENVELVIK